MRAHHIPGVLALCLWLGACSSKSTVTDGDRQLSHQNKGAAQKIKASSTDPEVTVPAEDIEQNSEQQLKNWGPPQDPKPYAPDASKLARKKSEEEHATPAFWAGLASVGGWLLGFLTRGGGIRLLGSVAPRVLMGPYGAALTAVIEGIARVRERAKETPAGLTQEMIMEELLKSQSDPAIRDIIKNMAHKIEEKLALHQ